MSSDAKRAEIYYFTYTCLRLPVWYVNPAFTVIPVPNPVGEESHP